MNKEMTATVFIIPQSSIIAYITVRMRGILAPRGNQIPIPML